MGVVANGSETVVVVDIRQSGDERRELYVDARDIYMTDDMTEQQFISLLQERGLQKLAEYNGRESVECEIDETKMANMEFSLGDKCAYSNASLGISAEGRVTELEEVIENGERTLRIILGREQLDLVRKIKRETR